MRKLLLVVGAVLAAAQLVAGGKPAAAGQISHDNRTLVVGATFAIKSLDPARAFEDTSSMVHKATYDTLVTLDERDVATIVPDLATSWEVSPDAKTFTYHLRQGVTFQNSGNRMTSADVKWSWERAQGIQGNPSFLLDGIASIETPDDATVVVRKSGPDPAFVAKGSSSVFAVLDSKTVEAHGGTSGPDARATDAAEDWLDQNSAGTGPFTMTSYTPESEVAVQKNPSYWGGAVPFDRVIYRDIPEAATEKLTLEAGDIDIATEITPDQVPSLQANALLRVVEGVSLNVFYLVMNRDAATNNGALSNPTVQLAVRYALDYDGINRLVGGNAVSPPSILPQGFLGAYPPERAFHRDLGMAERLLTQAGFPNGFSVTLQYPTRFTRDGVDFDSIAQKVQADLSEAKITVTLEPGDLQAALDNYRAGNEGFGFWFWSPDYIDPNEYLAFLPDGIVARRVNWTNANSDESIQQLRDQINVEPDNGRRAQLWQQAQDYLMQQGPYAAVIQPGVWTATRATIGGYVYNPAWRVNPSVLTKG
jgi:peptide/nickel transport system substrate-binding protein